MYQYELKNDTTIFDLYETDEEVLFRFKAKDIDKLEKYLKPRTSGANISPFSNKNRGKNKYEIPSEDLIHYRELIGDLHQEQLILVAKWVKDFLKSTTNKKNSWEKIRADMIQKGLGNKEYIHSIGKWNEFLRYMEKELNDIKEEG